MLRWVPSRTAEGVGILGLDAAPVQEADGRRRVLARELGQQAAEIAVHLAGLGRGRVDPGPDRPYRLVGEHHARDALGRDVGQTRAELALDGGEGQPLPTLLDGLTDAEHADHPVREHRADLAVDELVRLPYLAAPLGVPDDHVPASQLAQHRRRLQH